MGRMGRMIAATLAAAAFVVAIAAVAVYGLSEGRIAKTYQIEVGPERVADDPELVARGQHLARSRGCASCHADDLGGRFFSMSRESRGSAHPT
jgi:mono/diheme cytochrome c family protein